MILVIFILALHKSKETQLEEGQTVGIEKGNIKCMAVGGCVSDGVSV